MATANDEKEGKRRGEEGKEATTRGSMAREKEEVDKDEREGRRERERSREEKRRRLYELAAILAGTKHDIDEGRMGGGWGRGWSHAAHVASARRRVRHS